MARSLFTSSLRYYYRHQRFCLWLFCCAILLLILWYFTSAGSWTAEYSGKLWRKQQHGEGIPGHHESVNIHYESYELGTFEESSLFGNAQCILLNVDPFNMAVAKLQKDLGQLQCHGKKQYSSLDGNVLSVAGKSLRRISYRAIQFSNDSQTPFILGERKEVAGTAIKLDAGKSGSISHYLGKCIHPFLKGKEGTPLIMYRGCKEDRLQFKMDDDGMLKHQVTGLCVVPRSSSPVPNTKLVLGKDCGDAKYRGLKNGFVQHLSSKLCIHFQSLEQSPPDEASLVLFSDCERNKKMRFGWKEDFMKESTKEVSKSFHVEDEFVEVTLMSPETGLTSEDHEYCIQVPPKFDMKKPVSSPETKLNILMIMFHSTSAAHFKRKLPKSYTFLKNALKTVFVPGFSTIDDSTKSQLTAMLVGLPPGEINTHTVDSLPWLFKIAKSSGYVTLMNDDKPYSTMHSDPLTGFKSSRPDYYSAPFWAAVHRTYSPGGNSFCIGNTPMHNISFSYVQDFFTVYSKLSKFALVMNTEVSSWNLNTLGYVDNGFHEFLGWMKQEGHLEKTFLVVFSDHGSRNTNMRGTLQGKLEERMPHLSISLPTKAPKDLVTKFSNLVENAKGLVTPYDVYSTLSNILTFPKDAGSPSNPGQNLFDKIDLKGRSCKQLKIPSHWCPCVGIEKVSISEKFVKTAKKVIEKINHVVQKSGSSCKNLEFTKLRNVGKLMPNSDVLRFRHSKDSGKCTECEAVYSQAYSTQDFFYVLYIEASPGAYVYRSIVNSVGSDIFIHPHIVLVEGKKGPCTLG